MTSGSSFFTEEEQEPVSIRGLILALILLLELLCLLLTTGSKVKRGHTQRRGPNIWISFARSVSHRHPLPNTPHKGSHFMGKPLGKCRGSADSPAALESQTPLCIPVHSRARRRSALGLQPARIQNLSVQVPLVFWLLTFSTATDRSQWLSSSFGMPANPNGNV